MCDIIILLMKNALKHKLVYIIGSILLVVGLGVSFGAFLISIIPQLNMTTINYVYLLWIFGVVYLLVGFIWCDIRIANWRRKNKAWDDKVDPKVEESSWKARWTFWLPAFVILAVAVIFDLIAMGMGHYPFM